MLVRINKRFRRVDELLRAGIDDQESGVVIESELKLIVVLIDFDDLCANQAVDREFLRCECVGTEEGQSGAVEGDDEVAGVAVLNDAFDFQRNHRLHGTVLCRLHLIVVC